MTREVAIEELKILKEDYWDDDGYGHETKQYDDTMLALDMAIKALEQEQYYKDLTESYEKTINKLTKAIAEQEPTTKNGLGIDCISRQAVLNLFNKSTQYSWEMSLLKRNIEEMPPVTPQEPRWIPVSEKLPDKTGWYLITFRTYGGSYAVSDMCYRKPENYWTRDNICKKVLDNDEVVAWMPLPEAYSEEEA